ncbi:hypothetical protein [Neisseria musculi]|uniref:Uncharacterized protein n=1 Tax=Neisseria musculi TaxID=1815583 RepID=A0A7H1MBD2_9NEIS|nr:hypothetical protein [Neisseria musculi]QNT58947.1 hypothetical protein H7A79_1436 [Neisseria musculi]
MNHTITAALSGSAGKDFAGTAYARVDIDAPSERLTGLRKARGAERHCCQRRQIISGLQQAFQTA